MISSRDKYLRKWYSITEAEYDKVLGYQGGVCAGCGRLPKTKRLSVDHNHRSLQVRGLLCWQCNSILASLRDDPNLAISLANFLTSPPVTLALGEDRYAPRNRPRRKRRKRKTTRPVRNA